MRDQSTRWLGARRGRAWPPSRGRRGFSLLELMLAVTLGALLTVVAVQLFASSGRANAEHLGQARLQESARHALGFLGRSVRGAGYLGCGAPDRRNGLNGNWHRIPEFDISAAVAGFDGVESAAGAPVWRPDLIAAPLRKGRGAPVFGRGGINVARLRPGSDILVLRRVATPLHPILRPINAEGDPLVVLDPNAALAADSFAVLADCGRASLFRATSVSRQAGRATLARMSGGGVFGNRANARLFNGAPYGDAHGPGAAGVGLVSSEFYFVARGSGDNSRGESVWAMWRKTSAERPVELVRGIVELQVLFAVDTTPDDATPAPSRLVPAPDIGSAAVRGVQIVVTASAVDSVGANPPPRRTFAATFALRNS